jgi:hypothetical protein
MWALFSAVSGKWEYGNLVVRAKNPDIAGFF